MAEPEPIRLLVVEDDEALSEILCDELRARGHTVVPAATVADGLESLGRFDFDVALLDLKLPDGSGIDVLRRVAEEDLPVEAIVLTGYADVSTAIEAMKLGAYDYLSKPPSMEEIDVLVAKAAEKARLRRENLALRVRLERHESIPGLITEDPVVRALLETLERAAASDLPVLIQGESGTGKELIARAVHQKSPRAAHPFVAVHCAAVPENIIESELFGHERGAFTGAADRKLGLFEIASRGVLFLDEIGEISAAVQVKLLRALERKEFFRVGGTRLIQADVRVVTATNKDLPEEMAAGRFREDLYYRLNGVILGLPPLRERKGDIPLLARHFLDRAASRKMLGNKALEALKSYPWPGNVRELEMVIQRAAILSPRDTIEPDDLPLETRRRPGGSSMRTDLTLAEMEREYIKAVLERQRGHRGNTARALGIDPKTLYNKLRSE
jgi:two-component system, NtrC family, response regulator AtoC